jgi:uncharacterized metal-binding protein YceD (DUF177 family)
MDESFKIYVEQLRDGHVEELSEEFSPDFMGVDEADLRFTSPIHVEGEVYLAEDELVFHWKIQTRAVIPCSICNEPVEVDIDIPDGYSVVESEEIKTGIFVFQDLLRETILLETPRFAECESGNCPKREDFKKFLKEASQEGNSPPSSDMHHPFADLDWKDK